MPPRASRRRTRSAARLNFERIHEQSKRGRTQQPEIVSIVAVPVPERPPQYSHGLWVNDRYMRRKNREYMHAVHAAQEVIKEEMKIKEHHPTTHETQEEEDKEVVMSGDNEEEECVEDDSDDCRLEEKEVFVQKAHEEKKCSDVELLTEQEERSGRLELASFERKFVDEEATTEENKLVISKVSAYYEEKSGLLEAQSPEARAYSPNEAVGRQLHHATGIDPTPEKSAPPVLLTSKLTKDVARGIAQSSCSSVSNRKRMISFSPERAPRPENRALAMKKLEKNLKTNEKLQQRLQAPTPVKAASPAPMSSPIIATQTRRLISFTSPQARRPIMFTSPQTKRITPVTSSNVVFTSPPHQLAVFQSPFTAASCSLPLSQTEELVYYPLQKDHENIKDSPFIKVEHTDLDTKTDSVVVEDPQFVDDHDAEFQTTQDDNGVVLQLQDDVGLSQESLSIVDSHVEPLSQESSNCLPHDGDAATATQSDTTCSAFTSTSVIGDVGLFNCEADVEYTGGVYGEGTDGKVTAAVINGQKIALKRAKPYEGLSEHEAKHRAALELHYLRRVRHMKGFLQCLGLCDGIEHTCIALEVMDCKLSDYLRRYGVNSGGSKHRRHTLSFDDTKAMLKQICLPLITLHEEINVAHGDIACRNILMRTPPEGYEQSWEPDIKLSDFGRIKLPSEEPKILDTSFSFYKNCDVGAFGREILYRLLVGEIVPKECVETRSLHKLLQDVTVTQVPDAAKARLGPYYSLFMRCTAWGVRPTFREIYDHLNDLEYFETTENGLFPLKPTGNTDATFMSPVAEATRHKTPTSSALRIHKRDTPTSQIHRPTGSKSRLFASKSFTEVSVTGLHKPVNWLKTRSVVVQRTTAQQALTPTAHSLLIKKKKTPPSAGAGASRRSLQILNQIQHRTIGKGRKSN